uniref:Uncharacterized protein n=1 Tax=viral metagenome TaxID=1070528 RepID=A0A6M3IFC8_9ZZZZ
MANKLFSLEEVAAFRDRTHISEQASTIVNHSVTITLAASVGRKHYISQITLVGTAGTGAAESIVIKKGTTDSYSDTFTVGTRFSQPFYGDGWVGNEGEAVSIVASATNLTAAKLSVVGKVK